MTTNMAKKKHQRHTLFSCVYIVIVIVLIQLALELSLFGSWPTCKIVQCCSVGHCLHKEYCQCLDLKEARCLLNYWVLGIQKGSGEQFHRDKETWDKNLNSTKLVDDKRLRIDLASIKENLMRGIVSEISHLWCLKPTPNKMWRYIGYIGTTISNSMFKSGVLTKLLKSLLNSDNIVSILNSLSCIMFFHSSPTLVEPLHQHWLLHCIFQQT